MPPSYVERVLIDIKAESGLDGKKSSGSSKSVHAEHLFKLNEAVFNLAEEDTIEEGQAAKMFQTIELIRSSYKSGRFDNTDSNFFYDYLAMLATMQNQHFFTQNQTEKMHVWIRELMDDSRFTSSTPASGSNESSLKELKAENASLKKRLAKFEASESTSGSGKPKKADASPQGKASKAADKKGKGKGRDYDDYYDGHYDYYDDDRGKGKDKGKGKGKGRADDSPKGKAKGKGKSDEKGKGKKGSGNDSKGATKGGGKSSSGDAKAAKDSKVSGKGKDAKGKDSKDAEKGKGGKDGKGKGKKGKDDDSDDDAPPLRGSKGRGKAKGKKK